jgi:pimeloyl-ACP methyl ester carboxylesterase
MKKNLLLLHGALGSRKGFESWKPELGDSYNVHALDFEGHGEHPSSTAELSIERLTLQLLAYMEEQHIESTDIFGYSMGGYVALHLASIAPQKVRKVMTLGTKFAWSQETAAEEQKKLDPEKIEAKVPHYARYLQDLHPAQDWKALVLRTAAMMKSLGAAPLLSPSLFHGLPHEVCIGLGDGDTMVSREESEEAARAIPQGTFMLLANTPHPLEKVNQHLVITILRDFMLI